MGNVNAKVPLDNYVQNGDQTMAELMASIAAVNGGVNPGIVEIIRNPADGKLIQVELAFPEGVATAAIDAINENAGVPTPVGAVARPLVMTDLATADGMAWSGSALSGDEDIVAFMTETLNGPTFAPKTQGGSFAGTTYTDGGILLVAVAMFIRFKTKSTSADFTINDGDLTMKDQGGNTVPIILISPLVIPKAPANLDPSFTNMWIDVNGKMYVGGGGGDGGSGVGDRGYVDSVLAGAV